MDNYRPSIGTSVQDLDTPSLIVDLDALEYNMNLVAEKYRDTSTKMRTHMKNLKTPVLAHMQIRAGGTVGGVCTAKLAEAEVMVDGGVEDVFITNQIVTEDKIARLCSLTSRADVKVAIDDPRNLLVISKVAQERKTTVGVLIEVNTSMRRGGVRTIKDGVDLAKLAVELPGISFRGVMSHQTLTDPSPDLETRTIEGFRYIQICLNVKDAIEGSGIPVEIVSSGETWTYDLAVDMPGVTEVEGGSYLLMSTQYKYLDAFKIALKVLGTVVSTPRPNVAIGDIGVRALASPGGALPTLEGIHGVTVQSLHEEHIVLHSEESMPLHAGDKFVLQSGQQDIMVNRWDQFIAVRNGIVEEVWEIPARGCHN